MESFAIRQDVSRGMQENCLLRRYGYAEFLGSVYQGVETLSLRHSMSRMF